MPLPKPKKGESENDFVSKCMSNETVKEDFPDQDQRLAVCFRQFREEKMSNQSIRIKANGDPEIMIYDDIGLGQFGGISSKDIANSIKQLPKSNVINVRINSAGGDVFEGVAIYNTLRRQNAKIKVDVDGMALSAASVVAMAGHEVHMADNAIMMIHNPWTIMAGDAEHLRQMADTLEKTKNQVVKSYAMKTGLTEQDISQLMDAETWMTAEEAVSNGFADTTAPAMAIAAKFDVNRFKNIPKWAIDRPIELPRWDAKKSCPDLRAFLDCE